MAISSQWGNISALTNVAFYQANPNTYPTPRQISEKTELIELITDGCVLYSHLGTDIECGVGTIFWHMPGDYTINRYKSGQPYSCLVLSFTTLKPPLRVFPRYTVWDKPV